MASDKTTKVKIKIRAFPYYEDAVDPVTERKQRLERIATRGDEVELSDVDLERAKRFDAIETDEDRSRAGATVGAGGLSVNEATSQQVAQWIESDKPTVEETVAAANGDVNTARKLLEAEHLATGGDPRKGVEEGLQAIIENEE